MFKIIFLFVACGTFFINFATVNSKPEFIGKFDATLKARFNAAFSMVEGINVADAGWKAQFYPRFARMSPEERRSMNGLKFGEKKKLLISSKQMETPIQIRGEDLPEEFDPRKKWPECTEVINNIRDQSRCGDCWAVAAAGALSDRICIHSKGKLRLSISDIDVASCSAEYQIDDGCNGAEDLSPAWKYFNKNGAVTGSNYSEHAGCKPYPFLPSKEANEDYHTPQCEKNCTNEKYGRNYENDKIKVGQPILMYSEDWKNVEHLIKQEVFVNGSVEVGFTVYSDFYYYNKGIYKRTSKEKEGGHAVRLVGWGVENETPYWLIANSWGQEWGENGFFRIQRGTNEADIEKLTTPYTGMPILTKGDLDKERIMN